MARIAGVDLPRRKRIDIALTYIYGVGRARARKIVDMAEVDPATRSDELTESEIRRIRDVIDDHFKVEGELRAQVRADIKRLKDLGCYRGLRHRKGLPVRGQRTRTNARTRRGPRRPMVRKRYRKSKGPCLTRFPGPRVCIHLHAPAPHGPGGEVGRAGSPTRYYIDPRGFPPRPTRRRARW